MNVSMYFNATVEKKYLNDLLKALLTIKAENCKERLGSKVEDEQSLFFVVSSLVSVLFCTLVYKIKLKAVHV